MNMNDYQSLAMRTANIAAVKTADKMTLNAALGLCGEAGEFADIVKKHFFQNSVENPTPLDTEHLEKELGDVLWYCALAATALNTSLAAVMEKNIEKLKARYPEGFSAELSMHRKEGDI